jgi:hypothetical protein
MILVSEDANIYEGLKDGGKLNCFTQTIFIVFPNIH